MRLSVMVLGLVCFAPVVIGIAHQRCRTKMFVVPFLTSRPRKNQRLRVQRPNQAESGPNTRRFTGHTKPAEKQTGKPRASGPTASSEPSKPVNARIGIGLTLFMRDCEPIRITCFRKVIASVCCWKRMPTDISTSSTRRITVPQP